MNRPDWCPQDVWEVAVKLQDELYHWTDDPEPQEQDTLSFARAILAERERCAKVANERAAQLYAAINLPATDEDKAGWSGQMIEALMIEQRISQGHDPKQTINIEGLHAAATKNGFAI